MYTHALVTTDGSQTAGAAFPHAAKVVGPSGRVTVIEVVDTLGQVMARTSPAGFELAGSGMLDASIAESIIDAQRSEAERNLEAARAALTAAGATNVDTVIIEGMPGDAIVEMAHERGCDIVVMATHGRTGLRRTVLGSVADHVLRNLDNIPVLLIHPGEE